MKTNIGGIGVKYSARGNPTYMVELSHDGLKKHRLIRGDGEAIVLLKAQLQSEEWDERWAALETRGRTQSAKAAGKAYQEQRKSEAVERTSDAELALAELDGLLAATLAVDDRVDWETLKDKSPFPKRAPVAPVAPSEPAPAKALREPQRSDTAFAVKLGLVDRLISSRRERIESDAEARYRAALAKWQAHVKKIASDHDEALLALRTAHTARLQAHGDAVAAWEAEKTAFESAQVACHLAVDAKRTAYEARHPEAIVEYCDLVLSASRYPDCCPQEFDIDYDADSKTVVVDYRLPAPDDLPRLKSVKYVAARDLFDEQTISETQSAKLYDIVLYQIALRTIHELFEADVIGALNTIALNGIVTATDKKTGQPVTACVLSLRVGREEFEPINLANVDPKACFKALKGVASARLHGLAAVPPIMPLRRDDGRFVSSYEVANTLDDSVNLAAMDWEDFEHLIRELFQSEFSSSGGEVKVTQASRDGGVDAIAFDPDPIRGGKIVIQAKRYTNTVGVAAVRDLYGTVMNEGANKGILVTTSDYGEDSHSFAKGKPLVLLSGANLLHMLEKHGHRAKIDIQEARKMAK